MDRNPTIRMRQTGLRSPRPVPPPANIGAVQALAEGDTAEVLEFLRIRPVHTVIMASYIHDNGIDSELNRGRFVGYRNELGKLEGVALIGHSTLVEARSEVALASLAEHARVSETPIHLVMSGGDSAERFWSRMTKGERKPRLTCTERLFEVGFPFVVSNTGYNLRNADLSLLLPVAQAQAEVALMESGVDPLERDRDGFLKRVARRIEQGRVFVVTDGDELVFKADIIAETRDAIYLEGIYVGEKYRGRGIGSECLGKLTLQLLERAEHICLLSNVNFEAAHKSFIKAGYRGSDTCVTLFP